MDGDPVFKTCGPNALARQCGLRFRQRDTRSHNAVVLRGIDKQSAPAATNIKQTIAGLKSQLAADELELVLLRLVKVIGPIGEVATCVDHACVKKQLVEGIGDVIVMGDRLLIGATDKRRFAIHC